MVHLNVVAQTTNPNPITTIPTALRTNTLLSSANAAITRSVTISDSAGVTSTTILGPNAFIINHKLFNINQIDYNVPLNNTEIWQITNSGVFTHPFHIHDVEFNIISVNGVAPAAAQAGWKDVVVVPGATGAGPGPGGGGGTPSVVKFIAKFDDYADSIHPFMFHCHISLHEDEGMMGQFVVKDQSAPTGITQYQKNGKDFFLYPNPANDKLFVSFVDPTMQAYYIRITNAVGKTLFMLPRPELERGLDISSLAAGIYFIELTDDATKLTTIKKFIKQ